MRFVPEVGMLVAVRNHPTPQRRPIEEVLEDGRILVVEGRRFALNALTAEYVLEGSPYWGERITVLGHPAE
jgi:hypothetical protein